MASLQEVLVLDAKDGNIERIAYQGEYYVLTEQEADVGDIILNIEGLSDTLTANRFYKVGEIGEYVWFSDDNYEPHGWHKDKQGENFKVYCRLFEVGTYVEVVGETYYNEFEQGAIVQITSTANRSGQGQFRIQSLIDHTYDYATSENIKIIKDIDRVEDAVAWAEYGREPYEYRVGDIVRVVDSPYAKSNGTFFEIKRVIGNIVEDDEGFGYHRITTGDKHIELVATVDSRADRKGCE